MRTIAIVNQKGGSGKTTTAVNLAAALGERGKRVLLIDLDPQASTSAWYGTSDAGNELLEVFTHGRSLVGLVRETDTIGVSLVPTSRFLGNAEIALASKSGWQGILRTAIAQLGGEGFDFLLIDCPPQLGFLVVSALVACREVLVPVEASVMALQGIANLLLTIKKVQEELNPELSLAGVLACRVDARTNLATEVVESLRKRFGATVFATVIRANVSLGEAPSYQEPITTYAPTSAGAEDYRAVAAELIKRGARRRSLTPA